MSLNRSPKKGIDAMDDTPSDSTKYATAKLDVLSPPSPVTAEIILEDEENLLVDELKVKLNLVIRIKTFLLY